MNEEERELYNRLLTLITLFKNRPHHLVKYIINNSILSESFIDKLLNSDRIKNLTQVDIETTNKFTNITQIEDFYTSLITDIESGDKKEIENKLNKKMDNLIKEERFESAAKLRDYMKRKGIKRINNY